MQYRTIEEIKKTKKHPKLKRVFYLTLMPSARIELTFQASEACVLSITLQGQATYLLYKYKEHNSSKHFKALNLTFLDHYVYDKVTTEGTFLSNLLIYSTLEGGNQDELNSYCY